MKPLFEAINNIFVEDQEIEKLSKHPYYKGVPKDQILDRQKWFQEKKKKYEKDDYSVYKEKGPGQDVETKPSPYTKKVRKKVKNKTKKVKTGLSLSEKAELFNVPEKILKKVYRRGIGAWTSGHRPGVSPQQWGHARVNSFLTKGTTYYTADVDLAKQWKLYKKNQKK